MTLEQYAYMAEILGVALVVASLIYLARQLKQTTAMMRVGAANERVQRDYDIVSSLINSREVAEIVMKGESEFSALDDVDKHRVIMFDHRAIVEWHRLFSLRQQDLYSDSDWRWNEWIIQHFGRREAVREAWRIFRGAYDKPFQDYLDDQFRVADSRGLD
jgi:hypothetical protein